MSYLVLCWSPHQNSTEGDLSPPFCKEWASCSIKSQQNTVKSCISKSPMPERNTFHFRYLPGHCFSLQVTWTKSEQKVTHWDWGSVLVNQWNANLPACPSNLNFHPLFRALLCLSPGLLLDATLVWRMRHCCCDVCCHPKLGTLV